MRRRNQAGGSQLEEMTRRRFGDEDKDALEEHLSYIAWEKRESDLHKRKYFRNGKMTRWTALGCGVSSAILAFGFLDVAGHGFASFVKFLLILFSIMGPLIIAFFEDAQEIENNRETWIRHRIYIDNCEKECVEFCGGVKKYDGKSRHEAKKLLLEHLTTHRENSYQKFEENMKI